MKKYLLLLAIAGTLLFSSCENTDLDDYRMVYEETQCANPWTASPGQGNYLVEVRKYLEDAGINVVSLRVDFLDEEGDANCTECSCPSGRNIVITIPVADVPKAEAIGFVIDN